LDSYHIRGGRRIGGQIKVSGAKNAALPILAAAVLTGSESFLGNCPQISDVENMLEILRRLGCKVNRTADGILVDSKGLIACEVSHELTGELRSSVFLLGPMLARCGEVILGQPGGCAIGLRPINLHLSALRSLGAEIEERDGMVICTAKKLTGGKINLDFPSVGATENAMLAALGATGETMILNSAKEPEIVDLQDYLVACGARIKGAGTGTIHIEGGHTLHDVHHNILPDRIEGGTFLAAAAATGGDLLLEGTRPLHMSSLLQHLEKCGCFVKCYEDKVLLDAPERLKAIDYVVTEPYPGFPTDMQSQFLTLMAIAGGRSCIREEIFENRFKYVSELNKMGARIEIRNKNAIIDGVSSFHGQHVEAKDLRGGAALVIAGLIAEGETIIDNIEYIERGYHKFDEALRTLGADIQKK